MILIRKIKWQLMKEERLVIGKAILEKKEYIDNQHNLKNDGMCMVNRGYIIGYLSRNGIVRFRK